MAGVTPGLRALLGKQTCFAVTYWGESSDDPSYYERDSAPLSEAQVVSSAVAETWAVPKPERPEPSGSWADLLDFVGSDSEFEEPKHIVVVDVDHPAHLVESSTPGHFHLYVEIPPCSQEAYFEWLEAGVKIGLLEEGYVQASKVRGHTDVRLPWVRKQDTDEEAAPAKVEPPTAAAPQIPVDPASGKPIF